MTILPAFNVKELGMACYLTAPPGNSKKIIVVDCKGEEFLYLPDETALMPTISRKKWPKKKFIDLFNKVRQPKKAICNILQSLYQISGWPALFLKYANCSTISVWVDVNLRHPTLAVSKNHMIKLFSPDTEIDLAILKSLLEAAKIHYYVKNDHFGSLRPGPQIYLFNAKTIYVSENDIEIAGNILSGFLNISRQDEDTEKGYSWLDKTRMILEALLFGWFMPGKRRGQKAN